MDYNLIIKDFDHNISGYVEQLKEKIKDITFDSGKSVHFTISKDLNSKSLFEYKKKQGVYLFELNLDSPVFMEKKRPTRIKNFAESWAKKKNDSFFSSSVIKKRLKTHENFDKEWLPLYIGKSKDLYKRISEHIELSSTSNTYAMKLKHRQNLEGVEFRFTTLEFDVDNYDFIIPYVERSLREEYHPLVGKQ